MTTASIYYEVLRALKICPTRKPYDLLDTIGAVTVFSHAYSPDGLKGYSTIFNRTMYAVVNANLSEEDMMFAAGHEAAHLIVHKSEIMASTVKMMKDFNVFDHSGRYEKEANTFLADFLVSDEDVFEILSDEDKSYSGMSRELYLPAPLFAFKLESMRARGYDVRSPVDLDSRFLGRPANSWQM